jgi:hypothetical protein
MGIVYRKSAKGLEEIRTRAYRLAPRARSALILVDGQRSDEDLAKLIQLQAAETLALLRDQAFIEVVAHAAQAPSAAPVPSTRTAPPPPATAAPASTASPSPVGFKTVQREAVKRLTDLVGPAAEALAIRMERTKDIEELRPLVLQGRNLIANVRGQRLGEEYVTGLSAL